MQAHDIQTWTQALTEYAGPQTDTERIDTLRDLEVLKCAAEALQAQVTAELDTSQRAEQAAAGSPGRTAGPRSRRPGRAGAAGVPAPRATSSRPREDPA